MLNARTARAWLVDRLGPEAVAKHMVAGGAWGGGGGPRGRLRGGPQAPPLDPTGPGWLAG